MNDTILMHRLVALIQKKRGKVTELKQQLRKEEEDLEVLDILYKEKAKKMEEKFGLGKRLKHTVETYVDRDNRGKECPDCNGVGRFDYDDGDRMIEGDPCDSCNGSGKIFVCEKCEGNGHICTNDHVEMYDDCPFDYDCAECLQKSVCPECGGRGVYDE